MTHFGNLTGLFISTTRPMELDEQDDAFEKASFGGDRSAAGRYAANQRWQGQKKTEVKISIPTPKASDISKELKAYFGGTEKIYVKSQGYEEVRLRTILAHTSDLSIGDIRLEIIADKQGFSGLPKVVSADQMNELEKSGWKIVYRGIEDNLSVTETPLNAQDLAKQFMEGDYWGGFGTYANGTYCATDVNVAERYAHTSSTRGVVMKIAIPPNTIMDKFEFQRFVGKRYDESKKDPLTRKHLFYGDDDLGRLLMAKGYRGAEANDGIFVIWDRSMLAVQELDTTE